VLPPVLRTLPVSVSHSLGGVALCRTKGGQPQQHGGVVALGLVSNKLCAPCVLELQIGMEACSCRLYMEYAVDSAAAPGRRAQGLPKETVTWWFPMPENFSRIALLAIVICLIDVLESISIAKALAYKNHYELKCAARAAAHTRAWVLCWPEQGLPRLPHRNIFLHPLGAERISVCPMHPARPDAGPRSSEAWLKPACNPDCRPRARAGAAQPDAGAAGPGHRQPDGRRVQLLHHHWLLLALGSHGLGWRVHAAGGHHLRCAPGCTLPYPECRRASQGLRALAICRRLPRMASMAGVRSNLETKKMHRIPRSGSLLPGPTSSCVPR